jgi:cyclopropane-fatty-acyl-phospholipid synthase
MRVADLIESMVGIRLPVRIEAYDGSVTGDPDARTTVHIRSKDALVRVLQAPGDLGLARAYAAGDIEVDGDIRDVFAVAGQDLNVRLGPHQLRAALALLGRDVARRLPPPPEEFRPSGRLHSLRRDRTSVSHHYDLSNRFYELFLDESMTYSCAVFEQPDWSLEQAQTAKHELALRKLDLAPPKRLLDVGCGWGAHAIHAARHFGVDVVGITLADQQVELGRKRVAEAGLASRVELRLQDWRQVDDGPFDAVTSIGMFEHVGWKRGPEFLRAMFGLLEPGGRMLLHMITRPDAQPASRRRRAQFIYRYIFPDGELQRIGHIVDQAQTAGFDVIEVDALNQHYATTLDHWIDRLEANWDEAVAEVGLNRSRIWKLYLAASAAGFHGRRLQVQQITAIKPLDPGRTAAPLRPDWDPCHLDRHGG